MWVGQKFEDPNWRRNAGSVAAVAEHERGATFLHPASASIGIRTQPEQQLDADECQVVLIEIAGIYASLTFS